MTIRTYTIYFLLEGKQSTHVISGDISDAVAHVELTGRVFARQQALRALGAKNISVSAR